MEFGGVVGIDGLVGASSEGGGVFSSPLTYSDLETIKQKGIFGSDFLKQGRSGGPDENDWRCLKMARTDQAMLRAPNKAAPSLLRSNSHSLFPDGEQMLSFSSSKPDALLICNDGALPYYHHSLSTSHPLSSSSTSSYVRNAGFSTGGLNVNMHGVLAGVRGPFTPSQWMELEHQALIYKYIDSNAAIPPNLLIPIRKSLNPSAFTAFSAGSLRSSTLGWGSLHLGFSGNTDPEPGRCRRTDGKKWRCSRDAVANQKYCERHMNRGRHRSRKPVEGHNGHAVKAMPIIAPSPSALAVSGGGSSNSLTITQQQMKSLQPSTTDPSPAQFNRMLMSKENMNDRARDAEGYAMLSCVNPKLKDTLFPIPKQHNPFEEASSRAEFGLISSDSLLKPPRSSYLENRSIVSSPELNGREPESHPLRHFIDDWPKNQSNNTNIPWPPLEENRTQLSISIPMASSDFSSSSSSPTPERLVLSPLRLSREFDPVHMGLGVGGVLNEVSQRQVNWIPIAWEAASIGGPLGEVLTNTNNTPRNCSKNCSSSSLHLMSDGWDSSPRLGSSPTGVLQKTTFGSLSSSTGSSPRAENHKTHDSTSSLCNDLLGSTFVNSSTIPS